MEIYNYKIVFCAVGLIGIILIASPVIQSLFAPQDSKPFSQIYLLGPQHMAENYPFNIAVEQKYPIYVNIENHMGNLQYYILYLKFRNETDDLPNVLTGDPSSMPVLSEYRFLLENGRNWELPLNFSFTGISLSANQSVIKSLSVNNKLFDVNKYTYFNSTNSMFYYQLFFELWNHNSTSNSFQFSHRFVSLTLNATSITNLALQYR